MNRRRLGILLFVLAFLLPASALAQIAYTTRNVNVRAGPGRDYPLVTWLVPGTQVTVVGCLADWKWCDVIVGSLRGWVYARFLSYHYDNGDVLILGYGPMLGLPIVTFSIIPYWDSYYRSRPWYHDRSHWEHRPPPPMRPPGGRLPPRPPAPTGPMAPRPSAGTVPVPRPPASVLPAPRAPAVPLPAPRPSAGAVPVPRPPAAGMPAPRPAPMPGPMPGPSRTAPAPG